MGSSCDSCLRAPGAAVHDDMLIVMSIYIADDRSRDSRSPFRACSIHSIPTLFVHYIYSYIGYQIQSARNSIYSCKEYAYIR